MAFDPSDARQAAAYAQYLDNLATETERRRELEKLSAAEVAYLEQRAGLGAAAQASTAAELKARQTLAEVAETHVKLLQQELDAASDIETKLLRRNELKKAEIEHAKALLAAEANPAAARALQQRIADLERQATLLEESATAAQKLGQEMAGAFRIPQASAFSAKLSEIVTAAAGGALNFAAMGKSFAATLPAKLLDNMIGLATSLYDTEAAFIGATGASREMARGVTLAFEATALYGVTAEEASKATQSLMGTFTDFTMESAAVQQEHIKTAGVLGELGVSYDSYAKSVQTATKALGVSSDQADDMMRNLTAHAMDLGVPVGQLTDQFATMAPQLAKLGQNGVKAFKDMAHIFKITGFEMGKILALTEKFDTFEGAATMVGKLNAALGGNFVNAMDLMMEENPAERFMMIRDSLLSAGLAFDDMSYYQRKFYTESLGLGSVAELAQVMSGDMEALDANLNKTSAQYKDMAEAAKSAQSVQESLNQLLVAVTPILVPMIDKAREWILTLTELVKEHPKFTKGVVALGAALGTVVSIAFKLAPLFKALGLTVTSLAAPIWIAVGAVAALTAGFGYLIHKVFVERHSDPLYKALPDLNDEMGDLAVSMEKASVGAVEAPVAAQAVAAQARATTPPMAAAAATGGERPYHVTMELTLDGEVLDRKQATFLGGQVRTSLMG